LIVSRYFAAVKGARLAVEASSAFSPGDAKQHHTIHSGWPLRYAYPHIVPAFPIP
jgi:hypothetical protein